MENPKRRRRARPACVWQGRRQVMLCACLGLSARTIVPTTEAWRPAPAPAQTPSTTGRGGGAGGGRVAFSAATAWKKSFVPSTTPREALSHTSAFSKADFVSRLGNSRQGYRRAWGGVVVAAGVNGNTRRRVAPGSSLCRPGRPLMSMAGEDGGAKGADYTAVLSALTLAGLGAIYYGMHDHAVGASAMPPGSFQTVLETARAGPTAATASIQAFLTGSIARVGELGPLGPLYFGALYVLAEVLIIPAVPLTAAAGFLFGVAGGTAVVLTSATIAAAISFQLGRTLFREQAEGLLDENPKIRALDKAIAKEGFKVILLLRLSPIFPFALSNYLYGVSSVDFLEYMAGTMIGFFPGTLAYVYGGTLGKSITDGGGLDLPWYAYIAGAAFVAFLLKTVGEVATTAIEEMEQTTRDE